MIAIQFFESIIDSQSLMTASPIPSCTSLDLSFSVETTTSSEGPKSQLVNTRGNRSLEASRASIHTALSSLVTQRKWRVFVPVNIESLLSSDLLARIEETLRKQTTSDLKMHITEQTAKFLVQSTSKKKKKDFDSYSLCKKTRANNAYTLKYKN